MDRDSALSKIVIRDGTDDFLLTYTLLESVLNTFLASLKLPSITKFTETELLNLFASYKTVYFTVSELEMKSLSVIVR